MSSSKRDLTLHITHTFISTHQPVFSNLRTQVNRDRTKGWCIQDVNTGVLNTTKTNMLRTNWSNKQRTRKSSCVNARGIPTTAYKVLHLLIIIIIIITMNFKFLEKILRMLPKNFHGFHIFFYNVYLFLINVEFIVRVIFIQKLFWRYVTCQILLNSHFEHIDCSYIVQTPKKFKLYSYQLVTQTLILILIFNTSSAAWRVPSRQYSTSPKSPLQPKWGKR